MCHTDCVRIAFSLASRRCLAHLCCRTNCARAQRQCVTLLKASFGIAVGLFKCSLAEVDSGCIVV